MAKRYKSVRAAKAYRQTREKGSQEHKAWLSETSKAFPTVIVPQTMAAAPKRKGGPAPPSGKRATKGKRTRKARVGMRAAAGRWRTALRVLQKNEEWLKTLPNVHHIGMSTKYRKGSDTRRPSITVYVTKKQATAPSDRVPRRLTAKIGGVMRSVQTDVCELPGLPRLFNIRSGEGLLATSLQHTGTAGLVFAFNGPPANKAGSYCLTNAHVVSEPNSSDSSPVVTEDGGAGVVVVRDPLQVGALIQSDAALIRLTGITVDAWMIYNSQQKIIGWADNLSIGQTCFYNALSNGTQFTFQCQLLAFVAGTAIVKVEGVNLTYGSFYRFRVLNGSPVGGHSGSLLYAQTPNGLLAAGLAFGGIEGSEIWAFPARHCYDRMGGFFN